MLLKLLLWGDSALIERAKELAGNQNIRVTEHMKKMQEEKKEAHWHFFCYQANLKHICWKPNCHTRTGKKERTGKNENKAPRHLRIATELISQQKIYQNDLAELKTLSNKNIKHFRNTNC